MAAFDRDSMDVTVGGLQFGPVPDDTKPVVIGIDFGTAYSGVAFAYRDDPKTVVCGAPTSTDPQQTKVPTALLKKPDGTWSFGNDAENEYAQALEAHADVVADGSSLADKEVEVQLYKRFKMVLKDKHSGLDTLHAPSLGGVRHKLIDLVKISLEKLAGYALEKVRSSWAAAALGGRFDPTSDVQWVITVPAIWTDFGKSFMRRAAYLAGLIKDESSDNLMFVLEPEGASLAVHVGALSHSLLREGSNFTVLDCGGGTIDVTVHLVESIKPLKMKATAAPSGGAWGGDNVNLNFKQFLKELLGDQYKERQNPYGYHKVNTDFDKMKIAFDPSKDPTNISMREVLDNPGQLAELAASYNEKNPGKTVLITPALRRGFLTMSKELMMSFFTPLLDSTVDVTRQIVRGARAMDFIIVVGGFGSSKVLTDRIHREFDNVRGLTVITPTHCPRPQGAIAQGSVYYGMYKFIVQSRVAAYTYGAAVQIDGEAGFFSKMITKNVELPIDHEYKFEYWPVEDDQTQVCLKIYRSDKSDPEKVATEHYLGSITSNCPKGDHAQRRSVAYLCFGGSEIKVKVTNTIGEVVNGTVNMV